MPRKARPSRAELCAVDVALAPTAAIAAAWSFLGRDVVDAR